MSRASAQSNMSNTSVKPNTPSTSPQSNYPSPFVLPHILGMSITSSTLNISTLPIIPIAHDTHCPMSPIPKPNLPYPHLTNKHSAPTITITTPKINMPKKGYQSIAVSNTPFFSPDQEVDKPFFACQGILMYFLFGVLDAIAQHQ